MSTSSTTVSTTINFRYALTLEKINEIYNLGEQNDLDMCYEILDIDDVKLICNFLDANPQIDTLVMCYCGLSSEDISPLVNNNTIKHFFLGWNLIDDEGAKALAQNNTLKTLDVTDNKIGDEGAIALAQNNTLKTLNVTNNKIGDEGAIALAQNNTLESLDISRNKIGLEGVLALVRNKMINHLHIRGATISKQSSPIVIDALKKNTSLLGLQYRETKLALFRDTIKRIITRNRKLPSLQRTIANAHLFSSAQKSTECPLGTIPKEIAAIINDYVVSNNHNAFFMNVASGKQSKDAFQESARATVNMKGIYLS
jgi:Leucine Rich repeat